MPSRHAQQHADITSTCGSAVEWKGLYSVDTVHVSLRQIRRVRVMWMVQISMAIDVCVPSRENANHLTRRSVVGDFARRARSRVRLKMDGQKRKARPTAGGRWGGCGMHVTPTCASRIGAWSLPVNLGSFMVHRPQKSLLA